MKKLLVIFHLYYEDQLPYFLGKFSNIDIPEWDLLVTGSNVSDDARQKILKFKKDTVFLRTDPVGYDIWPFIQAIRSVNLEDYSVIIKCHTKNAVKEEYVKVNGHHLLGYAWRDVLVDSMLKDSESLHLLLSVFEKNEKVGMAAPAAMIVSPTDMPEDGKMLDEELHRIGIRTRRRQFCAGSMFAVRASLLRFLSESDLKAEMFSQPSRTRGNATLAHVYERILSIMVVAQGYRFHLIDDSPSLFWRRHFQPAVEFVFSVKRKGPCAAKYLTVLGRQLKLDDGTPCEENDVPGSGIDKVAIIIPAYKTDFLERALDSIAAQTCRDFRVYVGDDCSPCDIKGICDKFFGKMDLTYHRFESNMGKTDLVAHWERCIALSHDEKWIWLFSDDDMMPSDGVERLLSAASLNPTAEIFRFPLRVIDETDKVILKAPPFEKPLSSSEEYLLDYFRGKNFSATCEWVFSRNLFNSLGMVHFPCAWCSDIATWYNYVKKNGFVVNLSGKESSWRNVKGVNISSSEGMNAQKMDALIKFICWLKERHGLPFSKELKSATRQYIETILSVSLDFSYSGKDLIHLAREFWSISSGRALRICCKYLLKKKP